MELPKTYNAKTVEEKWYKTWEEKGYFVPKLDGKKKPFVIVIPPPNVTGILHMGHGLNNAIQDILIRWQRMKGVPTLWVPGTDHAGIATQNVVEKKLHQDNKTRHHFGRQAFIKEVWKWKEEHGSTIIRQLKRLGSSCDWSRERFTMDEGLSKAVQEVFIRLHKKGLIYQGNYLVNWCPRCHTALSDEEAAHKDIEGKLYYLKYPLGKDYPEVMLDSAMEGQDYIVVATTRPETMLGDTAVAINPKDDRHKHLLRKVVMLPLVNRPLKVIQDTFVDPEFGTGIVKVTPAHDPNDFEMGRRHNLEEVNVLNVDGTINENGTPEYRGLDRFDARKKIVEDLKRKNLFIKDIPHHHAVGHCYRCDTIIEPYLSWQWFVKMKPLAKAAINVAKKKKVQFVPERWLKVYLNWMENIRDWCISRQIWWGHEIPVWYCLDCNSKNIELDDTVTGHNDIRIKRIVGKCSYLVSTEKPQSCPACGNSNIGKDPDVLDTWFSSWLWPFSTLGWPDQTDDLKHFYPTAVLVTGPDILFFWVARMIMAGLEFMKTSPYHTVYLHGTVRDETGRKMSKSLGNSIDPIEIIEEIGADALRFIVISLTSQGQDVHLSRQKFMVGRNFTNKIWNAARFSFMNFDNFHDGSLILDVENETFSIIDRWILSRTNELIKQVEDDLSKYRFNDACNHLYSFIWNDFCDWYLELSKPVLYDKRSAEEKHRTRKVIFYVWAHMLKLLHPIMPHITEELWQRLKEFTSAGVLEESIMIASWPHPDKSLQFKRETEMIESLKDIIVGIREKRAQHTISPSKLLRIVLVPEAEGVEDLVRTVETDITSLGKVETCVIDKAFKRKEGWVPLKLTSALKYMKGFVYLGDIVDFEKERERLCKEKDRLENFIQKIDTKLKNKNFIQKAPSDVVAKEKKKVEDSKLSLRKIEESLSGL